MNALLAVIIPLIIILALVAVAIWLIQKIPEVFDGVNIIKFLLIVGVVVIALIRLSALAI